MRTLFSILSVLLFLSACGSSGSSGDSPSGDINLDEGGVTVLEEGQLASLTPAGGDSNNAGVQSWSWSAEPINEGALPACASVEGFELQNAARRLQAACTDPTMCTFSFDQGVTDTGATQFSLTVPILQAPIGLTYRLEAVNTANQTTAANFTFCLLSKNDPPIANDDTFAIAEGDTLNITGDGGVNLLSNDVDDLDSGNEPLSVVVTATPDPVNATEFSLRSDGGFTYRYVGAAEIPEGESVQDSFEYQITDGTNTATATAFISIITINNPPVAVGELPALTYDLGEEVEFDLTSFFADPEGSSLLFNVDSSTLPPSGELTLTSTGMLEGTTEAGDVGNFVVAFTVSDELSDGESSTSPLNGSISVEILPNDTPVSSNMPNVEVEFDELIRIEAAQYFEDEDPLEYSIRSDPDTPTLQINPETGRITGTIANAGQYEVTVSVDDSFNPAVTESFILTQLPSPNRPPVVVTPPEDVKVTVNEEIEPIEAVFEDPDGDTLTYSITAVPPGLSFDVETAVISGTPTLVGIYRSRIRATDPEGLSVLSDVFLIQVDAVPNSAPVPTAVIPNQIVEVGTPMAPATANFTDADAGTVLSYSITPAIPTGSGFAFDFQTGVLSGTPLIEGETVFTITASDGIATVDSNSFTITVTPPAVVNTAPVPGPAIGAKVFTVGDAVSISGGFTDSAQDTLSYTIAPAVAATTGLTFSATTGILSGTALTALPLTSYVITATDQGRLSTAMPFTLTIAAANTAPVAGPAIGAKVFTVGELVSISGGFSDSPQDTLSYAIAPAVAATTGLTFSATTGILSGTALTALPLTSYVITATDQGLLSTAMPFTLTIVAANTAPMAGTPIGAREFTVGDTVSISGGFTDSPQDTLRYAIAPAVAATTGLTFSATTGILGGTALTELPTTDYGITATDQGMLSTTMPFTLTILPANTAPMAGPPIGAKEFLVGEPVLISGGFTDSPLDTLSYEIAPEVAASTGLTFSPTTGVLGGTALTALPTTNYGITATDQGNLATTMEFTLTIIGPVATDSDGELPATESDGTG